MTETLSVTDRLSPEELAFLEDRIYEFNVSATGIDDGRWLGVLVRDDAGKVVAGLSGTTWGQCCKVRDVWGEETYARRKPAGNVVMVTHNVNIAALSRRSVAQSEMVLMRPEGCCDARVAGQLKIG